MKSEIVENIIENVEGIFNEMYEKGYKVEFMHTYQGSSAFSGARFIAVFVKVPA